MTRDGWHWKTEMPMFLKQNGGTFCPERPLLASGEVRLWVKVVMVVADTVEHARDACDLIDIEYTNLPAVTFRCAWAGRASSLA